MNLRDKLTKRKKPVMMDRALERQPGRWGREGKWKELDILGEAGDGANTDTLPTSDRRHCLPEATLSLGLIHGLPSSRSVLRFRSIKTIRRGPLPRAALVGKNQMAPGQQDRTEAYKSALVHRSTPVDFPRDSESLGSEEQLSPLTRPLNTSRYISQAELAAHFRPRSVFLQASRPLLDTTSLQPRPCLAK